MDYIISNPNPEQLRAVADCQPQAAIIDHEDRIIYMDRIARFYDRHFDQQARHCARHETDMEPEHGTLIPWHRLTEAQQNYLAVNLIRINDETGELEVTSEYLDGHDLLDYFTPGHAATEQPTL